MILAIDTNVLLDILIPNQDYLEAALHCLTDINPEDELIICEVVFAELGSQFPSFEDLQSFLRETDIQIIPSSRGTLFEASLAWKRYARRKRDQVLCPACGSSQNVTCQSCHCIMPLRQHIISDFFIGAHAKIQADKLITRDRGFYRAYFKDLDIVTP
jgi:predicted nucleic acid-binding protein